MRWRLPSGWTLSLCSRGPPGDESSPSGVLRFIGSWGNIFWSRGSQSQHYSCSYQWWRHRESRASPGTKHSGYLHRRWNLRYGIKPSLSCSVFLSVKWGEYHLRERIPVKNKCGTYVGGCLAQCLAHSKCQVNGRFTVSCCGLHRQVCGWGR